MKTFLKIENFKGIDNLELKELKDVNIIYGNSNTCKSSVLQAAFLSEKTGAGGFFNSFEHDVFYDIIAHNVSKPVKITVDEMQVILNSEDQVLHTNSGGWSDLSKVLPDRIEDTVGLVGLPVPVLAKMFVGNKITKLQELVNQVLPNVKVSILGLLSVKMPSSTRYIINVLATMLLCVDTLLIDDFDGKLDDELSEKLLEVIINYCKEHRKQIFIVTTKVEAVRKQTESVSFYKMCYHTQRGNLLALHRDCKQTDYRIEMEWGFD